MLTENQKISGSPDPSAGNEGTRSAGDGPETINPVESTKDRQAIARPSGKGKTVSETAKAQSEPRGTKTFRITPVLNVEKPCISPHQPVICISRKGYLCLHAGPCEPVDQDGNIIGLDREAVNDIIREDRADRIRADKENEEPIIDSDAANAALKLVAQLKRKRTHDAITSIQRAHGLVGRGS